MFLKKQPISQKTYNKIHNITKKAKNNRFLQKNRIEDILHKDKSFDENLNYYMIMEKNKLNKKLSSIFEYLKIINFDYIVETKETIVEQKDYKKLILTCIFLIFKNMIMNQKENLNNFKNLLKKNEEWENKFGEILLELNDFMNFNYSIIKSKLYDLCSKIFFFKFKNNEKLKKKCLILYDFTKKREIIPENYNIFDRNKFLRKCMENICLCLNIKNQLYCVDNNLKIKSFYTNIEKNEKINFPIISLFEKNTISLYILIKKSVNTKNFNDNNKNGKSGILKKVIKKNETNLNLDMKKTNFCNKRIYKDKIENKKKEIKFLNPDLDFSVLVLSLPNENINRKINESDEKIFLKKKKILNSLDTLFKNHQFNTKNLTNLKKGQKKILQKDNFNYKIQSNQKLEKFYKNRISPDNFNKRISLREQKKSPKIYKKRNSLFRNNIESKNFKQKLNHKKINSVSNINKNDFNIEKIQNFKINNKDKFINKKRRNQKKFSSNSFLIKQNNLSHKFHSRTNTNMELFIKKRLKSRSKSIPKNQFSYLFSIRSGSKEVRKNLEKRKVSKNRSNFDK